MRLTYFATDGNILSPPLVHEGTYQQAKRLALKYAKSEFPEWLLGFRPQIIIQEKKNEKDRH